MIKILFANNAKTTLAAAINSTDTAATLAAGTGAQFPSPSANEAFKMTFVDAQTGLVNEIVLVTARSGDVVTIERGQEGTTPRGWIAGDLASNYNTAETQADFVQSGEFQSGYYDVAIIGGTANAITGTVNSDLTAIPDNMAIRFSAQTANTNAVAFALTIGSTATTAIPIVKYNNAPLIAGDIPRPGYSVSIIYSAALNVWNMQNPASNAAGAGTVTGGANLSGSGVKVFVPGSSTSSTLKFNTLLAGANATVADNGNGTVTISSVAGMPPVTSVFGREGDVIAQPGDYTFDEIDNIPVNLTELANLILNANSALIVDGTSALAEVAIAANTFLARASTGGISSQAVSDFTLTLMSATTQANWRTALGLGTAAIRNTDNDPTMAGNSATVVPTQQAVVGYVTSQIAKVFKLIANWDASGGTFPSTGGSGAAGQILTGNLWVINVAGTLGTHAVIAGDMIVAATDSPGQTQANWVFIEGGLGYIPQAQNAALTQISTAGAATANTFWARASTGLVALKAITDAALSWLASITSTTGTGNTAVLANSPTLVTPNLGTPSAIVLTNASGTAGINITGNAATATSATSAGSAIVAQDALNIDSGSANRIPVQTAPSVTSFIVAPINATAAFLSWTGSAFAWLANTALTVINALTPSNDDFLQYKAGAWANRTVAQVRVDLQGNGLVATADGFRGIPQNSQSAAYTTVAADAGKQIYHPSADTTARTWTIDSNANVAYDVGTAITFINDNGAGVITIAITADTMRLAGAGTTGSRTLAANGIATATKITTTSWIISGTGLT